MKVSQDKKLETRRKLVNTAADLFVVNGFDRTTMKQIAREAGIGDATIYKYFPSKDKLILGFYDVRGSDAMKTYQDADGLEDYSFSEKLQLLVDTYLEQLMGDREFVEITLKQFFKSPISLLKDELTVAKAYKKEFAALLSSLEEDNNYPEIPMQGMLATLLTDYLLAVTLYWMKDDSEEFSNTTQLVDLSVNLIDSVLQSGLINKAMDMCGFIIKTHLLRGVSNCGNILSMMQGVKTTMDKHIKDEEYNQG